MSKVKYRVREYNPTSAQQGSHSFFAEAVINNEITNSDEPAQGGNSGDNNGGTQQGGGSQDTGGELEP
jgi:hypothetical protein